LKMGVCCGKKKIELRYNTLIMRTIWQMRMLVNSWAAYSFVPLVKQ